MRAQLLLLLALAAAAVSYAAVPRNHRPAVDAMDQIDDLNHSAPRALSSAAPARAFSHDADDGVTLPARLRRRSASDNTGASIYLDMPGLTVAQFNSLRAGDRRQKVRDAAEAYRRRFPSLTFAAAFCAMRQRWPEFGRAAAEHPSPFATIEIVADCEQKWPGNYAITAPFGLYRALFAVLNKPLRAEFRQVIIDDPANKGTKGDLVFTCVINTAYPDSGAILYPGQFTQEMLVRRCRSKYRQTVVASAPIRRVPYVRSVA